MKERFLKERKMAMILDTCVYCNKKVPKSYYMKHVPLCFELNVASLERQEKYGILNYSVEDNLKATQELVKELIAEVQPIMTKYKIQVKELIEMPLDKEYRKLNSVSTFQRGQIVYLKLKKWNSLYRKREEILDDLLKEIAQQCKPKYELYKSELREVKVDNILKRVKNPGYLFSQFFSLKEKNITCEEYQKQYKAKEQELKQMDHLEIEMEMMELYGCTGC